MRKFLAMFIATTFFSVILLTIFGLTLVFLFSIPRPVAASSYDIFVDIDNKTEIENGSEKHPFKSINKAVGAALKKDENKRKIYISGGIYEEKVDLEKNVELYGRKCKSCSYKTIIQGKPAQNYVVKLKDNSKIKNIEIIGGISGILVDEHAKAKIESVHVHNAKKIGVNILKSKNTSKEKVTVKDSTISNNGSKGFYIRRGKIELKNNKITNNKGEGIDLRARVKGTIRNNIIEDNKESGIEVFINEADVSIKNNIITNNSYSGISTQFYKGAPVKGNVEIESNKISANSRYAIDCSKPRNGIRDPLYWKNSLSLNENSIQKNEMGLFANLCRLP